MPIAQNGKKELSAPIFVGPSIATCDQTRQFSPSSTSGPITLYAPILQDAGTFARESMSAVECTFMEAEFIDIDIDIDNADVAMSHEVRAVGKSSIARNYDPPSAFLPSSEARPRELSINWQDTVASATRRSPT